MNTSTEFKSFPEYFICTLIYFVSLPTSAAKCNCETYLSFMKDFVVYLCVVFSFDCLVGIVSGLVFCFVGFFYVESFEIYTWILKG